MLGTCFKLVVQLKQKINNKRQNLNTTIKAFNQAVLKAAQGFFPQGTRKNCRPYWTEELQQQEDAIREAKTLVEEDPSEENSISVKATSAKHGRTLIKEADKTRHKTQSGSTLTETSRSSGTSWQL